MTELTEHPHPQLERDQGRVEGILEQVIARLDRLEDAHRQEMGTLRQEMNALRQAMNALDHTHRQEMDALRQAMNTSDHTHRQEMNALRQEMNRRLDVQLRWIIGIIIGVASLQVAVVSILLKVLT